MLRVLDVPAALEARSTWPEATSFGFTLRVHDPELPENEGPWRVRFDGERARCAPAAAGGGKAGTIDLEIPAAEFAQLYAGELGASDATRLGRASGGASPGTLAPMDRLFRSSQTLRLLDEF